MNSIKKNTCLSIPQKLFYAMGMLIVTLSPQIIVGWLIYFYSPPPDEGKACYVSLAALGIISFIGRIFDSVADPIVGYLSDRTKTRWGRRIPYIAVGTPLLAITFVLLWFPIDEHVSISNAVYLGVILSLFWILYTVVVAPYLSLLPEITPYREERITVSSYMGVFEVIGILIATLLAGYLIGKYSEGLVLLGIELGDGFKPMGIVIGFIILLSLYAVLIKTRETDFSEKKQVSFPFIKAISHSIKNPGFWPYILTCSFFRISIDMAVAAIPFLVKVLMGPEYPFGLSAEFLAGIFQGIIVIIAVFFFPLWWYLSIRYGKKVIFITGLFGMSLVLPLLFIVGETHFMPPWIQGLVIFLLASPWASVFLLLPRPILADIIDHDEELTGYRREAMYNGMEGLITKFAAGLATLIVSVLFHFFGNSAESPFGIRLSGPVAGIITLVGAMVFFKYPFKK